MLYYYLRHGCESAFLVLLCLHVHVEGLFPADTLYKEHYKNLQKDPEIPGLQFIVTP
jgi:hypothetical protein